MTFDIAAEFGNCWDADDCTMDPQCMNHDNCLVTEEEMAE